VKRPKLVATDLDGTVIRRDGTISDRTRAALSMVEDAGSIVVFVTGRPPRWLHEVAEQTGHRGLAVCANGALLYDLHNESVRVSHLISAEAIRDVCEAVRQKLPGVRFSVERLTESVHEPQYVMPWDSGMPWVRAAPIEELYAEPAAKLLVRHATMSPDELLALARSAAGGLAEFTHSSRVGVVEVSALGVSKASGLARICEKRGISAADVVAFGDMPNDLAMLAWAGTAYAMANAHPDVLAAVDNIAPAVDDDGVAAVLETLFAGAPGGRRTL
jgi:Cof subfamily protein (haloacid dehalogenase superfamily)